MSTERDVEKDPYSKDEARVAKFLFDLGAGGGDDPIGFILASHALMAEERKALRADNDACRALLARIVRQIEGIINL